jgi:hypothetical protein
MRHLKPRAFTSLSLAVVGVLAFAAPALAAAPANDTYAGGVAITTIPYSASLDTTEATTDADDAEWNAQCGAPATDASVWYSLTPAADSGYVIDASQSSYSAGIAVMSGTPGSFFLEACGPGAIGFFGAAGVTYFIAVFDDQLDGSGSGGTLELLVDTIPPPPTVDVTVDPVAQFHKDGSATVTGTVTCSGDAIDTFLDVQLRQRVGRFVITGFGGSSFVCDGTTQSWSADVFADNGLFKGGKAANVTVAFACGAFDCGTDFEETTVRLRR